MAAGANDSEGVWMHGEDDAYPTFSERLNKGQKSISDLFKGIPAEVRALFPRRVRGTFTAAAIGNGQGTTVAITFPAGAFTVPPAVFVSTGEARVNYSITNRTVNGCNVYLGNYSGGAAPALTCYWEAVQMNGPTGVY